MNREEVLVRLRSFLGKNAAVKIANDNGRKLFKVGVSQGNGKMLVKGKGYTWEDAIKDAKMKTINDDEEFILSQINEFDEKKQHILSEDSKINDDELYRSVVEEINNQQLDETEYPRQPHQRSHSSLSHGNAINYRMQPKNNNTTIIVITIVAVALLLLGGIAYFTLSNSFESKLIGKWRHSLDNSYSIVEYRSDNTFDIHIETIYGRTVGMQSGKWEISDNIIIEHVTSGSGWLNKDAYSIQIRIIDLDFNKFEGISNGIHFIMYKQ